MTKLVPGTYVLARDVKNPHLNRTHRRDWRFAEEFFKAGTRFTVVKQRWYHFEACDGSALERFIARWGEDMIERHPDGRASALELVLKRQDARDMYDVAQIAHAYEEGELWKLLSENLEKVEDTLHDVMDRARRELHVDGDDMIAALVRSGRLTLDDVRAVAAEAKAWRDAQPDDVP